ncbi:MAG TPA: hypothetical protein VFX59_29715 [Polyangiales bacterium]|nr:hypothetical protein [Polyangiales bacterium]
MSIPRREVARMNLRMVTMRHLPVLACALALAALSGVAWRFTVDDAFIAVRYAQRLASGLGYTYSGGYASDGVTGPLWLLPLVGGARLGLPVAALAKAVSCAASVVAACWMVARASRSARGRWAAWWVAGLSASSLPFAVWSVAGLETGLAALLVSWLVVAAIDRCELGVPIALLAWLRPELALFAGVLLLWRGRARSWLLAGAGVLALFAFRAVLFGHLLPMTLSAKPALLWNGVVYLGAALREPRGLLLALLLALSIARGGRVTRMLALAIAAHALAVVLAGGDWMPARRLFVPIVPALAFVIARGLRGWRYAPAALAFVVALGVREQIVELPAIREAGARRERLQDELARAVCRPGTIALIDVGLIGVLCPQQEILDLGGLTTPAVAYAPGGHLDKRIDEAWLHAQRATLVLHSRERPRMDEQGRLRWFAGYPVERRALSFARSLRVHEVFAYGPAYFYVVLEPPR